MEPGLIEFCMTPTPFFDRPPVVADHERPQVHADLPQGWARAHDSDWCYVHPTRVELPEQGWKIHLSCVPEQADAMLDDVWTYCVGADIPFKFIRSASRLHVRNSKYAERSASGKFVTIYPPAPERLDDILNGLEGVLAGYRGQHILSDLQFRDAPIYLRYGAFVEMTAFDEHGNAVPGLRDADGNLVPDRRRPVFSTPDWVTVPQILQESLRRRAATSMRGFPFAVQAALHFSNGGGVYRATHKPTGRPVLLKEARPLAGLDEEGADAVVRLRREHWAMQALQGEDFVPEVVDYVTGHHHEYLAREFVEGETLLTLMKARHPLLGGRDAWSMPAYRQWAQEVGTRITTAVERMHARGVVFGDVHPNNVLVREDGAIRLIDFETASPTTEQRVQQIGAPGFRAPEHLCGVEADRYSLACLLLSLWVPRTITLSWGGDRLGGLIEEARQLFDLDESWATELAARLSPGHPLAASTPLAQQAISSRAGLKIDDVVGDIVTHADLTRTDRLYPGSAGQFGHPSGGVTLMHGAAGVVWALLGAGAPVPADHVSWLCQGVRTALNDADTVGPGMYDGLSGLAPVLWRLGKVDLARDVMAASRREPVRHRSSLVSGLPGIGLVLLELHRLDPAGTWLSEALELGADVVTEQLWTHDPAGRPAVGMLYGPSASAAFLLRLAADSGEAAWRTHGRTAVELDLARLFPDGTASPGPWETPSMRSGGVGTAMVLGELHRTGVADGWTSSALSALTSRFDVWHHENVGLISGRAGLAVAASALSDVVPVMATIARQQRERLRMHRVDTEQVSGFLGDHMLKMSDDLAGGAAGVLAALAGLGLPYQQ